MSVFDGRQYSSTLFVCGDTTNRETGKEIQSQGGTLSNCNLAKILKLSDVTAHAEKLAILSFNILELNQIFV